MSKADAALWVLLLLSGSACERSSAGRAESSPARPALAVARESATPQAQSPQPLSDKLSHAAVPRLVAIGDLHGDLAATKRVLRLAGAIDASDAWIGGGLTLVQTGDVLDRGDDDREVLDLIERLRTQAQQAGGAVLALSGNHELMNVAHDFRYVTPGGFSAFASEQGRGAAFQPGGAYAALLAERPLLVRVGDTLFVHGGILPKHVVYGLDRMNDEVRAWMLGTRPSPPAIVMAEDGPIWTRVYSANEGPADCERLAQVLTALNSKRMVVGHTVQAGGITSACDGRVWRIDVGISKSYGGSPQALELRGDTVTILRD